LPPEINQKEVILFQEEESIPVVTNKNKKTNGTKVWDLWKVGVALISMTIMEQVLAKIVV